MSHFSNYMNFLTKYFCFPLNIFWIHSHSVFLRSACWYCQAFWGLRSQFRTKRCFSYNSKGQVNFPEFGKSSLSVLSLQRHSAITLKVSFKIAHIFVFISSLGRFPLGWTLSTDNSIFNGYFFIYNIERLLKTSVKWLPEFSLRYCKIFLNQNSCKKSMYI